MKLKRTRICANKGCNKEFKLYKTTDKYCSLACSNLNQKPRPNTNRTPINKFSKKRKAESLLYAKKRKIFLAKPENKLCKAAKEIFEEEILCSEVHHKAGRIGKLLNYVPYWLATSNKAHLWIHANPKEALKLGYSIKRNSVKI